MKQNNDEKQNSNTKISQNIEDLSNQQPTKNIQNNLEVMETQQNLGMKDIDELPLSNFVDIEKVKILKQKYPKYFKQYFAGSVLPEVTVTKTVDRFHCCITIMAVVFFLSLAAVIVTRILLINQDIWTGLIAAEIVFYLIYFIFTLIALGDPRIKKTSQYLAELNQNKSVSLNTSYYYKKGKSGKKQRKALTIPHMILKNLNIQKSIDYLVKHHQEDGQIWVNKSYEFMCESQSTLHHIQSVSGQAQQKYKQNYIGVRVNDKEKASYEEYGKSCQYCCSTQGAGSNLLKMLLIMIGCGFILLLVRHCRIPAYKMRVIYMTNFFKKNQEKQK